MMGAAIVSSQNTGIKYEHKLISSHLTIGLSGFALSSGSWTWLPSSTYKTVNINFKHEHCLIIIIEIPPFLGQLRNNS